MIADIADGSALAEELAGKHGRNATASMVCDVSDESQVKALVAKTIERFGKIDILVNNAALYSQLEEQRLHRDRRRGVGQGDGGERARAVPDGQARRAAHARQGLRQDHQYRLGLGVPRHAADAALHHVEGRDRRLHALALARGRRLRHLRQHAGAGLHAVRQRGREQSRPMSSARATTRSSAAPSSATAIRRICSGRWCSSLRPTAISSPAR